MLFVTSCEGRVAAELDEAYQAGDAGGFATLLIWHKRLDYDPSVEWLRSMFVESIRLRLKSIV